MKVKFEVKGLKELDAQLKRLPERVAKNILRTAVLAGAKDFADEAQRRAPQEDGRLKDSIYAKRKNNSTPLEASAQAGAGTYYALMVEQGHDLVAVPGYIPSIQKNTRKEKLKRRRDIIKQKLSGTIGKVAPRPFMRPTYDENREQAVKAIADHIAERIQREAKKG